MNLKENHIIDARVIALDESAYYFIETEDRPHIESIMGIYLYDKRSPTCPCSSTPSYWMIHIQNQVRLTPEALETLTDYEMDSIYERYEYGSPGIEDSIYMTCSNIDSLENLLTNLPWRYHIEGEQELPEDQEYDEYMEELREDCICNWRI